MENGACLHMKGQGHSVIFASISSLCRCKSHGKALNFEATRLSSQLSRSSSSKVQYVVDKTTLLLQFGALGFIIDFLDF